MASEAKSKQQDAISMLKDDHARMQKLFKEFESVQGDQDALEGIVHEACTELLIHSQLEEEIFYPAVREAIGEEDLLDEAEVEHGVANELVQQLLSMTPEDELYAATYTVLGEYVSHHINEEQNELFPKVTKSDMDLDGLGRELADRRHELEQELEQSGGGMPPRAQQADRPDARG